MNQFLFELLMAAFWLLVFSCLYKITLAVVGNHFQAVWRRSIWRVIVFGLPIICFFCGPGKSDAKYVISYFGTENGGQAVSIGKGAAARVLEFDFPVMEVVAVIWAAGCLFYLLYQFYRHWMFCDFCSRHKSAVCRQEYLAVWQRVTDGMNRRPELYLVRGISTPMLMGIFHTCVYLPDIEYDLKELELILEHEMCHYRRCDLLWQIAWLATRSVFWFHPIMPFLGIWMERENEAACDEVVLCGKDDVMRQKYCEALIRFLRIRTSSYSVLTAGFSRTGKSYRKRLEEILTIGRRRTMYMFLGAFMIGMVSCQNMIGYASGNRGQDVSEDSTVWGAASAAGNAEDVENMTDPWYMIIETSFESAVGGLPDAEAR